MNRYLLLKAVAVVSLMCYCFVVSTQETFYWKQANLQFDLPFNIADSLISEYEDGIEINSYNFDLHFEVWPIDSVKHLFDNVFTGILNFFVQDHELIVISSPQQFPSIKEGRYITAVDTFLYVDSLIAGVFCDSGSSWIVVGLIECWEVPLETGVSIMRSMRFRDSAMREEDN